MSSCFGYAEFQMPELRVNGDAQRANERTGLDIWNWKLSVSREGKIYIPLGVRACMEGWCPWVPTSGSYLRASADG